MITLDEATHKYYEDGVLIEADSVTGILAANGYTDFSKVPQSILLPAQTRGNHVHKVIQLALAGTLDYPSTDPLLLEYLETFNKFLEDYKAEVIVSELSGYSKVWSFSWTLDLVLRINDKLALFDIKSGTVQKSAALQTAAYLIGYEETTKSKIKGGRFCLALKPDGYKVIEYSNKRDIDVWKSLCVIHASRKRYL